MKRVGGDIKIINDNKVKAGACSDKNGRGAPVKLLKMGLVSIKMLRNETWKPEIITY